MSRLFFGGAGGYCPRVHRFNWLVCPTGVDRLEILERGRLNGQNVTFQSPDLSARAGHSRASIQMICHTLTLSGVTPGAAAKLN